ncbi:hypothetical protein ACIPJ1_10695 [Microbacterium maritypicum]
MDDATTVGETSGDEFRLVAAGVRDVRDDTRFSDAIEASPRLEPVG